VKNVYVGTLLTFRNIFFSDGVLCFWSILCVIFRVIPRCYRQFFRYRYFAGIRFAGFSVFRSVSIPPFFVFFPPFLPPFFQKGVELLKKGAIAPLLRKKGDIAPFLKPKCTNRIFLRYRYGKYREIPTEYRPKIPNRYTTLVILLSVEVKNHLQYACAHKTVKVETKT